MGYISYPRTEGSAKDIKRAEHVLLLIDRLLQYFNTSDVQLLLTLVSRIGWANLPPALRNRLFQLLYYDFFKKVKEKSKKDAKVTIDLVQSTSRMLVDIALQQQDLFENKSLVNLSLHERINKTNQLSLPHNIVSQVNAHGHEMLVFDNGIHVILTAHPSGNRYLKNQQKHLRLAIRAHNPDTAQTLKQAHKSGMLVTMNLLADHVIKQKDHQHPNRINQPLAPINYDIERIEKGMLAHREVRRAVMQTVECHVGLTIQDEDATNIGYQSAYRALRLHLISILKQEYGLTVNAKIICNFRYWVEDHQTQGVVCRYLTIHIVRITRQLKAQGHGATLQEWLEKIEVVLVDFFKTVCIKIHPNCTPCHYSTLESEIIAAAILYELQEYFISLNIPMDSILSDQLVSQYLSAELPK